MTENEEGPEPYLVPEKDGDGMTLWRLAEIEEAEKAGTPFDLTDAERAEVEESRSTVRTIMAGIGASTQIDWAKMTEKLGGIHAPRDSAAEMARRILPNPPYVPNLRVDDSYLDDIAESNRIKREREELNSANIGTTAEVMKDMLSAMRAEAEQSAARDQVAKASARHNFWVSVSSMGLAALAVIAPFVIEAIKGWK
jgi:hypothetical protein